jgi:hypothetical protein
MKTHYKTIITSFVLAFSQAGALEADAQSSSSSGRPWFISRAGNYVLSKDITANSGDAIIITASGVTLDLNGRNITTRISGTGSGIVIRSADHVTIKNGSVSGFNTNISIQSSEGSCVEGVRVIGKGLAPNNGPSEIGILVLNSRASVIRGNTVSSVNLGVFVRGAESTGNRIEQNIIVGGVTNANNLLGICYNPAPGEGDAGPSGDSIYNNHIARFGYAIAVSSGSVSNLFIDNTLASFVGAFREPEVFTAQGGTNAEFDNTSTTIITPPAP